MSDDPTEISGYLAKLKSVREFLARFDPHELAPLPARITIGLIDAIEHLAECHNNFYQIVSHRLSLFDAQMAKIRLDLAALDKALGKPALCSTCGAPLATPNDAEAYLAGKSVPQSLCYSSQGGGHRNADPRDAWPLREIIVAEQVQGLDSNDDRWLVTLSCGHKVFTAEQKTHYRCGECFKATQESQ